MGPMIGYGNKLVATNQARLTAAAAVSAGMTGWAALVVMRMQFIGGRHVLNKRSAVPESRVTHTNNLEPYPVAIGFYRHY